MLSVIAVFAISAGILLAAQSGCIGATLAGTDGSYNTPDTGLSEHAPVQAVTAWEGMSNLIVACQIADTFADMLFTGMLDTAYAVHAVLSLTAADNITDDDTLVLGRAFDITTFVSGGHTYAAVTAEHDSGVQILNITNPSDITPTDSITDGGTLELRSAQSITTFESGDHIYAAVTAFNDNGVQILNITNPSDITPTDSITDGGTLKLRGAFGITTFESGDHIYAAVTALTDNSVQILDVTNPSNITPAGSITDDGTLELNNPRGITTFVSGDHIYAAVAAYTDDGVQILDVTNPSNITAAGSITDGDTLVLNGPRDIAIFESGSHIYAAVATHFNNGVQILNITNPSDITPAGSITDGGTLELSNPRGITTFVSGSHTYAAVAAYTDDGVQILDVTDPSNITAAGSITDIGNAVDDLELDGAYGITTFTSGGHTYVAVAAFLDDGVQIIRIDIPTTDTTPPVIKLEGSSLVTITVGDMYTEYGAVCDDDVDADKPATVGGDTVDTSTVGQYTVTYDCTDSSNNEATQVSRTVNVQSAPDTDAPVIIITGLTNIQLTVDETYTEQGATCEDNVDADKPATVGGDTVDTSTAGQYTVTYDCTDSSNNEATQVSRTVNVQSAPDTDAPVIIITGLTNIQLTVDETYTEQGATCEDNVDADKPATVGGDTVDTSTAGQYTVTYDCTDEAGNNAPQVSRIVNVQATPPTFVSSGLDLSTRGLTIIFSETIDVTPAAKVDATKIHIRESGNYTHGVTLTVTELDTAADGIVISFTLNATHFEAVAAMTAPELTIDPGAVRDTSGSLIVGTFEASTASFVTATSISLQESVPTDIAFSSDGAKMFVIGITGGDVNEYELSTPFDASTLTFVDATQISEQETAPTGIAFSSDGTKMFVVGDTGDDVNEYELSTPFDASTRTFVDATQISEQETSPTGIAFSSDGTKMFVVGDTGGDVNEYELSTPFDASTRTFVDATQISEQETAPRGIAFSSDGAKMFVIGRTGDDVNEYELSTPFDASTLTFVDATQISEQETAPTGIAFSSDGTKMFVVGTQGDDVNEYALSSVYPIAVTGPPAGAFITTWKTTSADESITLPLVGTDITINWGDGSTTAGVSTPVDHTYNTAGDYTVQISGGLERFHLDGLQPNAGRLISIDQWGDTRWTTMDAAFDGATNMVYRATDTPDLSWTARHSRSTLQTCHLQACILWT